MSLKVAFQMDPLDQINPATDSTLLMMREAQARGYKIFHYTPDALNLENNILSARMNPVTLQKKKGEFYTLGKPKIYTLTDFDIIFLRQDPPFDMAYITTTYLLEKIKDRVLIVNDPASVRDCPEKIWATEFADLMPPTLISRDREALQNFIEIHNEVILKPLYGYAGTHIIKTSKKDRSLDALHGMYQSISPAPIVAQKYLPEIRKGSKRVVLIDGEPVGATAYIPAKNENRANLAHGGKMAETTLTKKEKEICARLKPELQKRGILFAGVDLIGERLIEINITSPAGLVSMNMFYKAGAEKMLWDAILGKLT